ncbi:hypothetical protein [Candidatus Williamhamiltonella defendens]|uniref:hypothetical protein n=1 Tax=Candidatus Williamhamiltonella defendens TaxID=138072 RepID=UPI001EE6E784|nr:hypothetical protein [Candidatus Hamiltonella defensa]
MPRDIADMRAALNDEDAWAQEFELQWLDEASAWLSYELIDSVVTWRVSPNTIPMAPVLSALISPPVMTCL